MKLSIFSFLFVTLILSFINSSNAQTKIDNESAIKKTETIIKEIAQKSFPEIKLKKIRVKSFESDTSFFKARFSFTRYLTFQKMRHLVYVNPKVFKLNTPENGIRSIIAHELAHILYYTKKNRLELLGLASLASDSFTAKFERKADLVAIKRGFGKGLIEYRRWLYKNIPEKEIKSKKRNYFSPEEIALILGITKDNPKMFDVWRKNVPRNIDEIKKSVE